MAIDLTDQEKLELANTLIDEVEASEKVLKDGQRLRTPMWAMDANTAHGHRPGYRVGQKLLTDSETRERLADAYEQYEDRVSNAWRNPGPVANTPAAAVLDSDFDEAEAEDKDYYAEYDRRTADAWKGNRDV